MILRGTVLSEKRVHLENAPAERERLAPALVPALLLEPSPQLSFDAVCDWLEEANEVTRSAVAALLAADLDVLRTTARSDGLAAGHAEGMAKGLADAREQERQIQESVEKALSALEKVTTAAQIAFDAELTQLADQCAEVVMAALVKIAGPALSASESVVGTVLQVLQQVKEERELVIRVAAGDLAVLQAAEARIAQALAGRKFTLVADRRVEMGGCLVESSLGSLDGRLEQQIRALAETIRAAKVTVGSGSLV